MKGIDKARLVSGLLNAKGRFKRARSKMRPVIAYEISLLRQRLGMGTGLSEDVLERVQNNPVDMSKTLTPEEYTKQVQTWMPHSFVSLEGMNAENSKGAVKALQDVILRYPKIVDDDNGLQVFSTAWGFDQMSKANMKRAKNAIDEIIERENLLEKVPFVYRERFHNAVLEHLGGGEHLVEISPGEASLFVCACDAEGDKKVQKVLGKRPIMQDELMEACWEALWKTWAKKKAMARLLRESPDLTKWDKLSSRLDLRSRDIEQCAALSCYEGSGGILFLRMYRDNSMQVNYAQAVATGYHVRGEHDQEPYGAAESVTMHELGHALVHLLGITSSPEFQRLRSGWLSTVDIVAEVSTYAATNDEELIAEAFCEYKLSASPRPVAMAIGHVIDNAYRQKFGEQK